MRKTPFTYASLAALYIACVVSGVNYSSSFVGENETILIPMAMLSLFVFSVALMGFLFVSEPILLAIEGKRKDSVGFFLRTLGFFACFGAFFGAMAISVSFL